MSWDFLAPRPGEVFPVVVATMGGAFSPDEGFSEIDEAVNELAPPDNRLRQGVNWCPRLGGHRYVDTQDARRVWRNIEGLVNQVPDPGLCSLLIAGKSSGGVLAWNTLRHHYCPSTPDQHVMIQRCALVLVDPHGAVSRDGEVGPYCDRRDLTWVPTWPRNRDIFRAYNIFQQLHPEPLPDGPISGIARRTAETLTGARLQGPANQVTVVHLRHRPISRRMRGYPNVCVFTGRQEMERVGQEVLHHMNIVRHTETRRLIQEAFRFARHGL